jgi:holo-[acyl-carrier protein] synthase
VPARVGIDLVFVEDVRASAERWSDRYLRRVFTPRELADCAGPRGADARALAARFAAKEAAMKVLRPRDEALPWQTIEVCQDAAGAPVLALSGAAARLADRGAVGRLSLSVGQTRELAVAIVVASGRT